jgi:outer membrane protein OmpA-like peptidoglycan-associated protein
MALLTALLVVPCRSGWAVHSPVNDAEAYQIMVIDYYTVATKDEIDEFKQMVESYLSTYIARCADIEDNAVILKKSKKETLRDINAIVKGALTYYEYTQLKDFNGFSAMIEDKLSAIDQIDFRKSKSIRNGASQAEIRSIQEFYLQKELEDLKILINIELGMFSGNNLMVKTSSEQTLVDPETKRELLKQYTGSDRNAPLGPIKVKISDESLAMINFKDTSTLDPAPSPPPANNDLMGKVLELLEQNNRKLDLMQAQMDQMRVEQIQMWQQQQDAKNLAMQNQIDELRTLVAGGKIQPPKAVAPSAGSGEVLNFPQKVELYYATGSSQLDASSQFALNEIVDLLARQPNVQVVISGYADKTGSPEKNLLISQKRASVVKAFFVQSGLDARRFVTKYHGDKVASETGNNRRVVVEFIVTQ